MYPSIEPFHIGYLQVSPIHVMYYEQVGNPNGPKVVFLHGGPGGSIFPNCRRFFDPSYYHIILFDQRGSGKSTPYGSLQDNTTAHIIEDMETLRNHLQIPHWIVFGGSWGSTLALAYSISHPTVVNGLVLRGIFLSRQTELDWLYKADGAGRLFPMEYKRFIEHLPPNKRNRPIHGYYEILTGTDEKAKMRAAFEWDVWEISISQLVPYTRDWDAVEEEEWEASFAIARMETHYFVNGSFLPNEDYLLEGARKLAHIPTFIIQGRYDIVCPCSNAFDLAEAMPHANVQIIPDAGHSSMEEGTMHALVQAMEQMKYLRKR